MRTIVAIDPGVSGGIAIAEGGSIGCRAMPDTQGDLLALLRETKAAAEAAGCELACVVEAVGGFVGKAQPGSAMFRFGEHFGFIKGAVQALGVRLVLVRPQIWQKGLGVGTASACASKTEWKNKLKAEAQRRFPHLTVTLRTADALLILDYALRAVEQLRVERPEFLQKGTKKKNLVAARSESDALPETGTAPRGLVALPGRKQKQSAVA